MKTAQIYDSNTYVKEYTYLGIVGGRDEDRDCAGSSREISFLWVKTIEVMKPDGENLDVKVRADPE